MDDRTSVCPTCGQRAPHDVAKISKGAAEVIMWVAVGIGFIAIGLTSFFVGIGIGILSVFPITAAVLHVEQRRLDRLQGRWGREHAKTIIEGDS